MMFDREEVRLILLQKCLNTECVDESEAFVDGVVEMDFLFLVENLDLGLRPSTEVAEPRWQRRSFACVFGG